MIWLEKDEATLKGYANPHILGLENSVCLYNEREMKTLQTGDWVSELMVFPGISRNIRNIVFDNVKAKK